MFKNVLFATVLALFFVSCKESMPEGAVARLTDKGTYEIDTEKAKAKILTDLKANVKKFKSDTVEVVATIPVGDKHSKVYFLQLTDRKQNLKLTRYLFFKDSNFYFYEDLKGTKPEDVNMFFESYYSVAGEPGSTCNPNIAFSEGELFWITGNALVCAKSSPCTAQSIVLIGN